MTNRLMAFGHHHEHENSEEDEIDNHSEVLIFDANNFTENIPVGFNVVRIPIDGKLKADLNWDLAHQAALRYIEKGLKIFWEIDLGLFENLTHPLANQAQFLSLCLSLEHFRDTLWKQFKSQTVGICLYRGKGDFSLSYPWDKDQISNLQGWLQDLFTDCSALTNETGIVFEAFNKATPSRLNTCPIGKRLLSLFCCKAAGEYLELLGARLTDAIRCFILLDITEIDDPLLAAQLVNKERYPRFCVGVKGKSSFLGAELNWEGEPLNTGVFSRQLKRGENKKNPSLAICLPSRDQYLVSGSEEINNIINIFEKHSIHYRMIQENRLTIEWDGLDFLFVSSKNVSPQGIRKLQGFCAAGGIVIGIDKPMGLPEEISFNEWWKLQNIT